MGAEQTAGPQFIPHGSITTRCINLGLTEEHRKSNASRSQPLIDGLQQLFRDSQTAMVWGDADFGNSSDEKISGFRSDDFLMERGVGHDFTRGAFGQPAMPGPL